jgi:hypothetical protein
MESGKREDSGDQGSGFHGEWVNAHYTFSRARWFPDPKPFLQINENFGGIGPFPCLS